MSLARKYDYIEPAVVKPEERVVEARGKISFKQCFYHVLPYLAIICLVSLLGLVYVERYVELNRLQVEIFDVKQINEGYEKQIYALEIRRDAIIGIDKLEEYAASDLAMIIPTESNKVVLKTNDYYILDRTIAFKNSSHSLALDDNKNKKLNLAVEDSKSRK